MAIQISNTLPLRGSTIDADVDNTFSVVVRFSTRVGTVTSGDLVVRNRSDNSLIDMVTVSSLSLNEGDLFSVVLPSGTATNDNDLTYTISLTDSSGTVTSNLAPIFARERPTISITVPNIVTNQKLTVTPTYTGTSILSTRFILYDSNDVIITAQDTGVVVLGEQSHTFEGLINGSSFGVEAIFVDDNGFEVRSGIERFAVTYTNPTANIPLDAIYDPIKTAINVTWSNLVQTIATITGSFSYVLDFARNSNTALRLNSGATWSADIDIPENFTITKTIFPTSPSGFTTTLRLNNEVRYQFGYDRNSSSYFLDNQGRRIYSRRMDMPLTPFLVSLQQTEGILRIFSNTNSQESTEDIFTLPTTVIAGRLSIKELGGSSEYNMYDVANVTITGTDSSFDDSTNTIVLVEDGNVDLVTIDIPDVYKIPNNNITLVYEVDSSSDFDNSELQLFEGVIGSGETENLNKLTGVNYSMITMSSTVQSSDLIQIRIDGGTSQSSTITIRILAILGGDEKVNKHLQFGENSSLLSTRITTVGTVTSSSNYTIQSDLVLRRLPNELVDEYNVESGILRKRISEPYTLITSDITSIDSSTYTNVDIVFISKSSFTDYSLQTTSDFDTDNNKGTTINLFGFAPYDSPAEASSFDPDDLGRVGQYYNTDDSLALIVTSDTYSNVTDAQTALSGLQVIYELDSAIDSTPTVTESGFIETYAVNTEVSVEFYLDRRYTITGTTITLDHAISSIDSITVLSGNDFVDSTGTLSSDGLTVTVTSAGTYNVSGSIIDNLNSDYSNIVVNYPTASTDERLERIGY